MSEPKRWLDEGPPEAVERLLHAASAERPPEASMSRALTALGLGAGATGAATTAATTAGAATAGAAAGAVSAGKATSVLATSVLVKWGLMGGALAVASAGGTVAVRRAFEHGEAERVQVLSQVPIATATTPAPAATANAVKSGFLGGTAPGGASAAAAVTDPPPNDVSSSPLVVPLTPKKTASKAPVGVTTTPAATETAPLDAERLAEEVALVDRARGALARGDAKSTLAALDDYDARFSPRRFAPEALYLRMEALLRLGQTSAARAVAARLASTYPSSPNAARARQVLSPANP